MNDIKDMTVTFMLDPKTFTHKPTKNDVGSVSVRLQTNPVTISIEELKQAPINGHALSCGYFNTPDSNGVIRRANECWTSQQIFGLDYDYGMTIDEFTYICNRYKVQPIFAYTTYNHTEEAHRFRAVFLLDKPVKDKRVRFMVYNTLVRLFDGKTDQQCKDEARLFFGGLENILETNSILTPEDIVKALATKYRIEDPKNYSRHINKFCQECSLNMTNGFPAVKTNEVGELQADFNTAEADFMPIKIPTGKGKPKPNSDRSILKNKTSWKTRKDVDLEEIPQVCALAAAHESGEYLPYSSRYHLALNYIQLEGGETRFMKAMDLNSEYGEQNRKEEMKVRGIDYAKAQGYMPSSCSSDNCPFFEECTNRRTNILLKLGAKRGEIRQIELPSEPISIAEAEEKFEKALNTAFALKGHNITVIKGETGLGKTEGVTKLNHESTMIAVPTHKLGREFHDRLREAGHNFLLIPERPELPITKEIEYNNLQRVGMHSKAQALIFNLSKEYMKLHVDSITEEQQQVLDYTSAIQSMRHAENLLVTHKRIFNIKNKVDTLIIDEDIMMTELFSAGEIKANDVGNLVALSIKEDDSFKNQMQVLANQFLTVEVGVYSKPLTVIIDTDRLEKLIQDNVEAFEGNIEALLTCDYFVRTEQGVFQYGKRNEFSNFEDTNIIILSATSSEKLYRKAFGKEVQFIDIGTIKKEGKIVTHYDKSFSRNSLNKMERGTLQALNDAKEIVGERNVITYAKHKASLKELGFNVIDDCHFGATTGIDKYKGEDLAVIGTPNMNPAQYIMTAKLLGIKVTAFDQSTSGVKYILVERNGYEFYYNTYSENAMLQEIQFTYVESELLQAVGRARALRNNCTVHVFTNLPIA
ncbi:hypothetical protein [Sporosarcina sp. P17b]|uniref:hypothetical protein n=1 Tax=Sporosarcina sp. P17b TaxID=2048260 RepID=UPI000C173959|nr:hypothetical protein [Sporosarcina sp. P17b]PIC73324.1 hypothetical protein CSV76_10935 [Sporosarcina sp. P17b]